MAKKAIIPSARGQKALPEGVKTLREIACCFFVLALLFRQEPRKCDNVRVDLLLAHWKRFSVTLSHGTVTGMDQGGYICIGTRSLLCILIQPGADMGSMATRHVGRFRDEKIVNDDRTKEEYSRICCRFVVEPSSRPLSLSPLAPPGAPHASVILFRNTAADSPVLSDPILLL